MTTILLISYLLAFLKNPGLMSAIEGIKRPGDKDFCEICQVAKLENSEHCEECGICVENWEGHYSWLGKCIGKGNYNFFVFFNLSLLIWTV